MADYLVDFRDVQFLLYEHLNGLQRVFRSETQRCFAVGSVDVGIGPLGQEQFDHLVVVLAAAGEDEGVSTFIVAGVESTPPSMSSATFFSSNPHTAWIRSSILAAHVVFTGIERKVIVSRTGKSNTRNFDMHHPSFSIRRTAI